MPFDRIDLARGTTEDVRSAAREALSSAMRIECSDACPFI